MSGKVLVVIGSPRKAGNSATLAAEVARGAREAGAEVEVVHLHGMDIRPCASCGACQESEAADCVQDDAMQAIYPKVREATALVIASPVYWFTMSAQTKLFLDRCFALGAWEQEDEAGRPLSAFRGKRIGIVMAYADADPFRSGAVNALRAFQDAFRFAGARIAGMVYASASGPGDVAKDATAMGQAHALGRALA
ncbi:MAG: flavodoxin family protein [Deltaproteobacteria bacterium]|nr:flavodoxin family protein [Deltaproteobacteria bacterium]